MSARSGRCETPACTVTAPSCEWRPSSGLTNSSSYLHNKGLEVVRKRIIALQTLLIYLHEHIHTVPHKRPSVWYQFAGHHLDFWPSYQKIETSLLVLPGSNESVWRLWGRKKMLLGCPLSLTFHLLGIGYVSCHLQVPIKYCAHNRLNLAASLFAHRPQNQPALCWKNTKKVQFFSVSVTMCWTDLTKLNLNGHCTNSLLLILWVFAHSFLITLYIFCAFFVLVSFCIFLQCISMFMCTVKHHIYQGSPTRTANNARTTLYFIGVMSLTKMQLITKS